jgi:hypothetical protein
MSPFHITGPAIISFSGGRTSAYMLWRILDAHDGKLPDDVHVCFANTGREMPATLDFVEECASRWGVRVNWLEYRRDPETGRVWTETVSYNSASRNGGPFRALLAGKQMLPNPTMRFCTEELKIRPVRLWIDRELGWRTWKSIVGLRYDELHRVVRIARRNASGKARFVSRCPLAKARVTKAQHIMPFWAAQPFDLRLHPWEGNCDGCFLKSLAAKRRLIADHPERLAAWRDDELLAAKKAPLSPDAALYRNDGPSYAELFEEVRRNPRLPGIDRDPGDGTDVFVDGCDVCGA